MDAVPSMTLRLALGLTTALVYSVCQAQTPTLKLLTFESPPYQMAGPGADGSSLVVGETANTVACAANRGGWATRIRIAPQNRAIHSLERKMIDGYFAIDPSSELDTIAKRSDPVALEKWYFFSRDNRPFSRDLRIGVVSGSTEEAWLEAKKRIGRMTSSMLPSRAIGIDCVNCATIPGPASVVIAVSIIPGATALARTLCGPPYRASDFVRATMAALLAL